LRKNLRLVPSATWTVTACDDYLLECCRYADLNPKRAGMVRLPQDYRWSSGNEKIGRRARCLIDEDFCYLGMGRTRREREMAYRDWVLAAIPDGTWTLIRDAVQRGQLTANRRFIDEVERRIGHRIELRPHGRPWACNKQICPH
jgi:putative transposase